MRGSECCCEWCSALYVLLASALVGRSVMTGVLSVGHRVWVVGALMSRLCGVMVVYGVRCRHQPDVMGAKSGGPGVCGDLMSRCLRSSLSFPVSFCTQAGFLHLIPQSKKPHCHSRSKGVLHINSQDSSGSQHAHELPYIPSVQFSYTIIRT